MSDQFGGHGTLTDGDRRVLNVDYELTFGVDGLARATGWVRGDGDALKEMWTQGRTPLLTLDDGRSSPIILLLGRADDSWMIETVGAFRFGAPVRSA